MSLHADVKRLGGFLEKNEELKRKWSPDVGMFLRSRM